jgi:2-polyprenyl-3-methyl-5-hydroxy-6-metoxy-1,4-benzoquinol methylase
MENPQKRLTTNSYWTDYYGKAKSDKNSISNVVKIYDHFWDLMIKHNGNSNPKDIVEIGGYPGRYLAYISSKYNLKPTSLDFNKDRTKIEQNMAAMEVNDYEILHEDFLNYTPSKQYDLLLSIGFIEHFSNFDEVLDKHMQYVKKGSTLFINVPNMRYYIKFYKTLLDKKNLDIHNLDCMHLSVFRAFAERNNLEILSVDYFGGFPFTVHQPLNGLQRILYNAHRFVFKRFINKRLEKKPSKYFSSTISCVFRVR